MEGSVAVVLLTGLAVVSLVLVMKQRRKMREHKRKQMEEERRMRWLREDQLKARAEYLRGILSGARRTISEIRALVPAADFHLDGAEEAFAERAFAPFWDEIERAAKTLASYQRGIATVHKAFREYQSGAFSLAAELRDVEMPVRLVPGFVFPRGDLPDPRPAERRLTAMVRKAQTIFEFASIFEQRRTNKILIEGFGTLEVAIRRMNHDICSALDDLSTSVGIPLDELLTVTREQSAVQREHFEQIEADSTKLTGLVIEQGKQATAEMTARQQFEQKVIESHTRQEEMLDNIQRHRKP